MATWLVLLFGLKELTRGMGEHNVACEHPLNTGCLEGERSLFVNKSDRVQDSGPMTSGVAGESHSQIRPTLSDREGNTKV